jgi:hypothetical protein
MKNETLLIQRTKLMQQEEIIKNNVEKAIEDERDKYAKLKQESDEQRIQIEVLIA